MAITSRVSSKFQTVIPKQIRERLHLNTGDTLRFRVTKAGAVLVEKDAAPHEDPFTAFTEWASEEDERIYRDL